ncbi:MAG: amidohydrolase [Lachnoclostridium sp.]|nr:amidohydrolase [Lachnospira sp.]MCM1248364.1 amidohydrolase [Lachnoclostridium sp.]MCM1536326.1 amidohydrolase [Clostridium sp.]
MNIRLYNARILTMEKNRDVFWGEIWIRNDKIAYVAGTEELDSEWNKADIPRIYWDIEVDCKGNLLMPGFKNAHAHSAMTFLRSYGDDVSLQQWLNEKVFPMEKLLTPEDIYELTKLAILEYLSSGITAVCDMYLSPDSVAEACMDMGMRCVLVSGLNNFTSSIRQVEKEYKKWNKKHSLISYQLGFHAEYTCSQELLCQISALAHEFHAPVYTHLAETQREVEECKARYGMTPAMLLDSLGIFEFGGGGFHCVHMTEEDMNVLRMRRMHVITNPASNMKLASGIAPIAEFVKRRIPVAIGTDGAASNNSLDMFKEMFLTSCLSKIREQNAASMSAGRVLRMATVHGAKAMRLNRADTLAKGKYADIIMIDLNQPNMQPIHSIPNNLVYSCSRANVIMTMIGGKILYWKGEYNVGEDPGYIYEKCNRIVQRMIDKKSHGKETKNVRKNI